MFPQIKLRVYTLNHRCAVPVNRSVLRVKPRCPPVQEAVAALHSLVQEEGVCGAERYCLIHAIMLHCRQSFYPPALLLPTASKSHMIFGAIVKLLKQITMHNIARFRGFKLAPKIVT